MKRPSPPDGKLVRPRRWRWLGVGAVLLGVACTRGNPAFHRPVTAGAVDAEEPPPEADAEVVPDAAPAEAPAPLADLASLADSVAPEDVGAPAADRPPDRGAPDLAADAVVVPCGTQTLDVSAIKNADGLAIDDDGAIYYLTDDATHSYVGQLLPGHARDDHWVRIDNSPVTWGLALDRTRKRLYVAVVSGGGAIVRFENIKGTPVGKAVVTGIKDPNDVVVADDGTVYYDDQGDRNIYAVSPAGQGPILVSRSPLGNVAADQSPAALTMMSDGSLLVGLEHDGPLYRLLLSGGTESSRERYGKWLGWANGLTFDGRGRLYISIYDDNVPKSLVRIETSGVVNTVLGNGRFSSLAFGRGPLDCRDLYVADPFGPMQRVRVPDAR
jgi:sugar lactone lactonase YvrE